MVSCARRQRAIAVRVAHQDFVVGWDRGSCGEISDPYGSE